LDKYAVITGGVRRLGRHISYYLADEGFNLVIIYNSSLKKELEKTIEYLETKRIKYRFYKCDLRNLKVVKKTFARIKKELERIDLLVNNSGIIRKIDLEEITPKVFDDTINVNLRSMLFTSQYCLPLLMKSKNPQIINFASLGGLLNWANYIPYGISKAGVIKLTQLLAKRLAPEIRVNAIAPGTIIIKGEEAGTPAKTPMKKIPLKKYGSPSDIISAIHYLINSPYVTGQIITVDGGRLIN
jgi:NAD(P)-dependent dehydrogenase (short-subunit alcohol dehydrogenase family)